MGIPAVYEILEGRASGGTGSNRGTGSNSLSGIISTLIPTLLIAIAVFTAFLVLRLKAHRVYNTRGLDTLIPKSKTTPYSDKGIFGWIPGFRSLPDVYVLNHNSLDGYLYLRFFKMIVFICAVGCCITWPILFPLNATGGGGQSQLDILSFSNVNKKNYFYGHALVSWVFLGFVMVIVARERLFFVGLRQAYYFSPFHAKRLSSRVVLFLSTPQESLQEASIRQTFGNTVRKIWFAYDCKQLEEQVEKRDKLANKLEGAEVKMITTANKNRLKAEKDGKHPEKTEGGAGSAMQYVDAKKPPTHKLGLLGLFGKKVETIPYGREHLPLMEAEIQKLQQERIGGTAQKVTAVFVEFSSQIAAQDAYFQVAKSKTMRPRYIGVQPDEVIWKNLSKSNGSRKTASILASTFIALLIIFWAIPVAIVGAISNINYLTNKVHFLSFINDIPTVILGVVTGLLPSVALAILMAFVPIFCRILAKLAGAPTLSAVELQTQKWYFWFQVIQVFLITTFTSAASAVASQIVANPSLATSLLAKNLPKASNFYISYFIIFGLGTATMQLLQIGPYVMNGVVGNFLDKTPRKKYNRWFSLATLGWGSVYPVYTNIALIAITYSGIAPLMLGFATIGLGLLYLAFRYNWLYSWGNKIDMKGESYPLALHQLLGGVYLAAICLAGLFGIAKAWGPLVLMLIFLAAAAVFQIAIEHGIAPLETVSRPSDVKEDVTDAQTKEQYRAEEGQVYHSNTNEGQTRVVHEEQDGKIDGYSNGAGRPLTGSTNGGNEQALEHHATKNDSNTNGTDSNNSSSQRGNFLTKFLVPHVHSFYEGAKAQLEGQDQPPEYMESSVNDAYQNPAITSQTQVIWLPKDSMGLSQKLVLENREARLESSDDGAWLNEKGKVDWDKDDVPRVPIWKDTVWY